jgi:peptidoglycan/LPS O-acetylase OafA/YrhL
MRRFAFLDSLRGLAAVYVVLLHMTLVPTPNLAVPHWLSGFVMMGGSGVTLFFVISAFSLCYTIAKHSDDSIGFSGFYIRRFFRIAPLFCLILSITIFRDIYLFSEHHKILEIFQNIFFAYNFIPGSQEGIVWASWTIGVEMIFYAIFPLLFKYLDDIYKIATFILFSLIISAAFSEALFYLMTSRSARNGFYTYTILRHLPIFAFGILSYEIFKTRILNNQMPRALGLLLIGIAIYGYISLGSGKLDLFFVDQYYWQAVIYGCLVLGLAIYPLPIIVNAVTTYLGRVSYSIYLLHPLIVLLFRPMYRLVYSFLLPTTVKFMLCTAATLIGVVATASVTYLLVEEPGMRLGKHVLAWLSRVRRQASMNISPAAAPRMTVASETHRRTNAS